MQRPHIKTTLFLIGILPTLLVGITQIGLLSYPLIQQDSPQSFASGGSAKPMPPDQPGPILLDQSQYETLAIGCLITMTGGLLFAYLMAIYYSRQLDLFLRKKTQRLPDTTTADSESPLGLTSKQPGETQRDTDGFSVLIADDNSINRLLLINQLEGRCGKITVAEEGTEALHHLKSVRFDLILLDLQMPGHSGHELIKLIRNQPGPNAATPVIAITAHAQLSQRQKIIAEGFDECLIKPILTEQLDEIIALWHPTTSAQAAKTDYSLQILDKTGHNQELALTIAKKLFAELSEQLPRLEVVLNNHNYKTAVEITHKLHGSVSFCGLTDLQKDARALEQSLLNHDYPQAMTHFYRFQDSTRHFIDSKKNMLKKLSAPSSSNPK